MNDQVKTLRIIHVAMGAGTTVFCIIIGIISDSVLGIPKINSSSILWFTIPIIAFFLSNFLFKSKMKKVKKEKDWDRKLMAYQNASLIRWAILEGAALIIPLLNPEFLMLSILIIIYLIFLHPTENRINIVLQVFG